MGKVPKCRADDRADGILTFRLRATGQSWCSRRRGRRADYDRRDDEKKAAAERARWAAQASFARAEPERDAVLVHDRSKVRGAAVGDHW